MKSSFLKFFTPLFLVIGLAGCATPKVEKLTSNYWFTESEGGALLKYSEDGSLVNLMNLKQADLSYELDGNSLTVVFKKYSAEFKIIKLTDTELIVEDEHPVKGTRGTAFRPARKSDFIYGDWISENERIEAKISFYYETRGRIESEAVRDGFVFETDGESLELKFESGDSARASYDFSTDYMRLLLNMYGKTYEFKRI